MVLKQLWKNSLIASAFFLSSVIVPVLHERVGIRDELAPFNDLIADQNCLVFGALDKLVMYCCFAFFNLFTALFLSCLYFYLDTVSPLCLYCLYVLFFLMIIHLTFRDTQGTFLFFGRTRFGIHCSMIDKNFSCQMQQTSSTPFPENKWSQSVSSIRSEALAKSAWEYFQIDLRTEDLGFFCLMVSTIPL